MSFDPLYHPYPSYRLPVYANKGMVATSQALASAAGLDILKRGGNAIDAAIATAAALTVVEPCSNGIGGDAFALVWTKGQLHGLNSSGPAPATISIEAVKALGHHEMPRYGAIPVTVPGTPAAWAELSRKFGRLPLAESLEPAIRYAEDGYPVSPTAAANWHAAFRRYSTLEGEEFAPWLSVFAPGGRPPAAGEMWRSPDHARTLRLIGSTEAEAFYRGDLAERIAGFISQSGGFLSEEDLAAFKPEWVKPMSVPYHGYDIWEIPPNGQGLIALIALNILKGFPAASQESAESYHRQIEAMKLAFADGARYITDAAHMSVDPHLLLTEEYGELRRGLIGGEAMVPAAGEPRASGTVYLAAADGEGNMVSFIQSNYTGFGSGIVVPGTGIALQNRGLEFSLEEDHANRLVPGKRTYHTIIPGFITKGEQAVGPFGVMGGYMQPQGHVQVAMNLIDYGLHPQAALDAPRWQWVKGKTVTVEPHFPMHMVRRLQRMGHDVQVAHDFGSFGRGQVIWRDPDTGVLCGGTDPRTDGGVAVW